MKNIKVLFIAYQFPPKAGPGVHRSLNFAKHLPDFKYDPIVFTIRKKDILKENASTDNSLLDSLPKDIKIIRTPSYVFHAGINFLMRLKLYRFFWYCFYPLVWEFSALWPILNYPKALKTIKKEKIPLVYTSSGPYSALVLGFLLKKTTKVKWVADLRDPYTDAYAWVFPSKLHWHFARWFEKKLLAGADKVVVNSSEVYQLYKKTNFVKLDKMTVINNGYV